MSKQNSQNKIDNLLIELADLKEQLADLEKSLPAHSIRPHQMIELEDMEDLITTKKAELKKLGHI